MHLHYYKYVTFYNQFQVKDSKILVLLFHHQALRRLPIQFLQLSISCDIYYFLSKESAEVTCFTRPFLLPLYCHDLDISRP